MIASRRLSLEPKLAVIAPRPLVIAAISMEIRPNFTVINSIPTEIELVFAVFATEALVIASISIEIALPTEPKALASGCYIQP